VVSQTHAVIFGPDLPRHLRRFVAALHRLFPDTVVLLHPGERGSHPFGPVRTSRPPHAMLSTVRPALVLAHCSTMAIDAAAAGHWVASIDFPVGGNALAHGVADSPLRVADAAEAFSLYLRLAEDGAFRLRAAARQQEWLDATFARDGGGLADLLRRVCPP